MSNNAQNITTITTPLAKFQNSSWNGGGLQMVYIDPSSNLLYYSSNTLFSAISILPPYTNIDIPVTGINAYTLYNSSWNKWCQYNGFGITFNTRNKDTSVIIYVMSPSGAGFTLNIASNLTGSSPVCGCCIYNDKFYIVISNDPATIMMVWSAPLTKTNPTNPFGTTTVTFTQVYASYTKTNIYPRMCTFDNVGNLYITSGSGVYVYPVGSSYDTTPTLLISPTKSFGNIMYSSYYNILYICNLHNSPLYYADIDLYYTNGQLLKSSYIKNISIPYASAGLPQTIQMDSDALGNFYTNGLDGQYLSYITKILCFKEDTQILTINGYKLIQDLRKNDLVKTVTGAFKPIYKIGFSEINHVCSEERINDQLYRCSTEKYPELFEDLILTGCHCILVDEFKSEEEQQKAFVINGDKLCMTDDKYRLPACIDDRTSVYEVAGNYKIFHFSLKNDDYYVNDGIYANGLLVETTSNRFIDLSIMTEIE